MRILIAGNYWHIRSMTKRLKERFLKMIGCSDEHVALEGFCLGQEKCIYVAKGLHKESRVNTLLHEGLHAIILEIGAQHGLRNDEKMVYHLTAEILNYLKQTMTNFGPKV